MGPFWFVVIRLSLSMTQTWRNFRNKDTSMRKKELRIYRASSFQAHHRRLLLRLLQTTPIWNHKSPSLSHPSANVVLPVPLVGADYG